MRSLRLLCALLCMLGTLLLLAACGGGKPAAGAPDAPAPAAPAPAAPSGPLAVGQTATLGKLQVTLKQVQAKASTLGPDRYFLLAEFDALNNGDQSVGISALGWFKIEAPDGRVLSVSAFASREAPANLDGTLQPGQKRTGWVGFELPRGDGDYSIRVKPPGDAGEARFRFPWPAG